MTAKITVFLEARIDEDEVAARSAARDKYSGDHWEHPPESGDVQIVGGQSLMDYPDMDDSNAEHIARHDPARVLAECAVRRRFIRDCRPFPPVPGMDVKTEYNQRGASTVYGQALQLMAAAYSAHPDYEQEWALDG